VSPLADVQGGSAEGSGLAIDEDAVRHVLDRYREAYNLMDVPTVAQVWPSVDRRILTQAFSGISSQDLTFERCEISMEVSTAVAYCRGTIRFSRKAGHPMPRTERHQWLFKLRSPETGWQIETVIGSELTVS
jgi:hypothetical protein